MMEAPNLPNTTVGQRTDLLFSLAEASPLHRFHCNSAARSPAFPRGKAGEDRDGDAHAFYLRLRAAELE
jgi:hypothetical protein